MTDAENGSATVVGQDAGISDAANGGKAEGSAEATANPFSGLDTGIQEWLGSAGMKLDDPVKLVTDLTTKVRGAESIIGKSLRYPGDDAKPEDIDKFILDATAKYRPESAEGYDLTIPDGVPEDMPYDAEFSNRLKAKAHELGFTSKQLAGLHDWYVDETANVFTANKTEATNQAKVATEALEKTFGARDTEPFKSAVSTIDRVIKTFGEKIAGDLKKHGIENGDLMGGLKAAGVVNEDGVILNAPMAIFLHQVGKSLLTEDSFEQGGGGAVADNPFADGPGQGNMTKQHMVIKQDRAKAIRMIRAAGHKPEDFGIRDAA